jgi:hypothetical protein
MSANTSLHAGFSRGWPHDHKAEDAYEAPPHTWDEPGVNETFKLLAEKKPLNIRNEAPEFKAEFGLDGSSRVYLHPPRRLVGSFETHADAQLAAEALNNHKGY